MPLHLCYTDSVAPQLDKILEPILRRHIDFKLRDSFRLLVPDSETRQDIERVFLEQEALGGVLIGKSILTLSSFAQSLLLKHPDPYPLASLPVQRKALGITLQSLQPEWKLDLPSQYRCLRELQELERLKSLRHSGRETLGWKALRAYQETLEKLGHAWTQDQAMQAAWALLEARRCPELESVEDLLFLGFRLPAPSLLGCLEALQRAYPALRIQLYLPPRNQLYDAEGRLEAWRHRLEDLAKGDFESLMLTPPRIRIQAYPTPAHEVGHLLTHWKSDPNNVRIRTTGWGPTNSLLESQCLGSALPQGFAGALGATSTQLYAHLLATLEAGCELDVQTSCSEVVAACAPIFQYWNDRLAKSGDLDSLRFIEAAQQRLREWLRAEAIAPEDRPWRSWLRDLKEDLLTLRLPLPAPSAKRIPLRRLERSGLERAGHIFLAGLNEGAWPPAPAPRFFEEEDSRFLSLHEAKLALNQCLFLASETTLSFSQFSLSGRAQLPSPLLAEIAGAEWLPEETALPTPVSGHHRYFRENVEREFRRSHLPTCDLDRGNLTSLDLTPLVLERLAQTPLSASYLDDFAKCPWRFFARWQLRLKEIPEEDLEIEPRKRGSHLHRLLEVTFAKLIGQFFEEGLIPSTAELQVCLETEFHALQERVIAEGSPVPPLLLRDQLARLRDAVLELLEEERKAWTESSERLIPKRVEWSFGRRGIPGLNIALASGHSVPLTGAIDRIDVSEDGKHFLLIDYKSSGSEKLAKSIRGGRSLQFWIYLQAVRQLLYPRTEALGGLYWDLKKLKKDQGMARRELYKPYTHRKLSGHAKSFMKDDEYSELETKLEKTVHEILAKILRGDYSLQPEECLGNLCEFREICRYDDKPRS